MDELRPLENQEDSNTENVSVENDMVEDVRTEEVKEVPFGLMGAAFLCNVLQYAVFLGITMVVLIIIRVFMPALMMIP